MYGHYGLKPDEMIKLITKEAGRQVSKIVKVVREYLFFVLVEVNGQGGEYKTCINKSWIFTKEAKIARV